MVFFSFFSSDVPPDYYSFSDVPSDEKKAAAPLRAGKLRQKIYEKKVLTAGSAGAIPDRQSIIAPCLIAVKLLSAIYTVNILYHRGAHISSIFLNWAHFLHIFHVSYSSSHSFFFEYVIAEEK